MLLEERLELIVVKVALNVYYMICDYTPCSGNSVGADGGIAQLASLNVRNATVVISLTE